MRGAGGGTRHALACGAWLTVVAAGGLAEVVVVVVERAMHLGEQAIEHWTQRPNGQSASSRSRPGGRQRKGARGE